MNARRRIITLVFSLAVGLTAVFGLNGAFALAAAAPPRQDAPTPTPQPAASAANVCDELQVIFIADQSGSMAGYTDPTGTYYPPTDPNGMRFDGLGFGVNTLLGIHYPSYVDVSFKAAIIDFGDVPVVRMGWRDLNPLSPAEADAQTTELAPLFDPTGPMGNTLPGDALEQAGSMFSQQDTIRPQVDGCPRRLIILLTDGLPFDDVDGFNWHNHLADAAGYAHSFLPYPDYRLYVIGLDQNGAFFDDALGEWANVTGSPDRVLLASGVDEMGAHIATILYDALDDTGDVNITHGCADNGEIVVPPYKQQLRISLFKVDPNLHLEVDDPGGRRLDDSQDDVTITGRSGVVETIVVTNPQPGIWRVLTELPDDARNRCVVNYIAIPAQEQVLEPADGARVAQFSSLPIVFQLVDEAGNALPDYREDRYDLQMAVEIRYADGPTPLLSMSANPGQQYRGEALALHPGAAEVFVHATALDDRNQSYTIFDKSVATFQVDPVSLVAQTLPAAGGRIGQHTETPLGFAIVDSAGQPVEISAPITLQLTHTVDGQPQTAPALTQSGGVFSGALTLQAPGRHTLAYAAVVDVPAQGAQPAQSVTLEGGEVSFEVFPVNLIQVDFPQPAGGVATDPLLQPTGLPLTVRLVDHQGVGVSPASTGAPDPTKIFDVTITDANGQVMLQGTDQLVITGEPGVFHLRPNTLGRGDYSVVVRPATAIAENYTWGAAEWTTPATGAINPLFYGVVAAALAAVGVAALLVTSQVRVRQHPLRGSIELYEKRYVPSPDSDGEMETRERVALKQTMANRNKITLRPTNAGDITRIVIASPNAQAEESRTAQAVIYRRKMKPQPVSLSPNNPVNINGTPYYIAKDRRSDPGSGSGSDTAILSDTFN